MKKQLFFIALVCLFLPTLTNAQDSQYTADEIAEKYIEVIGGEEVWAKVSSMQMEGKMAMGGMSLPTTITMGAPNKMRVDINVNGQSIVQSYDGETAWQISPMMGITTPTKMSAAEAESVTRAEIVPEFIDYEERGSTIELVEGKEIEGVATQGVKLTKADGYSMIYYFDLENFVPIASSAKSTGGPMAGAEFFTLISDYQEVDGKIVPHFMEVKVNGQSMQKMTFSTITFDEEIAEGFFSMPK